MSKELTDKVKKSLEYLEGELQGVQPIDLIVAGLMASKDLMSPELVTSSLKNLNDLSNTLNLDENQHRTLFAKHVADHFPFEEPIKRVSESMAPSSVTKLIATDNQLSYETPKPVNPFISVDSSQNSPEVPKNQSKVKQYEPKSPPTKKWSDRKVKMVLGSKTPMVRDKYELTEEEKSGPAPKSCTSKSSDSTSHLSDDEIEVVPQNSQIIVNKSCKHQYGKQQLKD